MCVRYIVVLFPLQNVAAAAAAVAVGVAVADAAYKESKTENGRKIEHSKAAGVRNPKWQIGSQAMIGGSAL